MKRVYAVNINGRTMESCNLKELLARAVSAKRNSDHRITMLKTGFYRGISTAETIGTYSQSGLTVIH